MSPRIANPKPIRLSRNPDLRRALIQMRDGLRSRLDKGTDTGVVLVRLEEPILIRLKIVERLLRNGVVSYDIMMESAYFHSKQEEVAEAIEEIREFVDRHDGGDDHLMPAS